MSDVQQPSRKPHVCIVDDDDDLRFALRLALREAGFEVRDYAATEDALCAIQADPPMAILLDLHIEGASAEQLVAALHARYVTTIPVIVLSGAVELEERARQLQAFAWLKKPCDIDRLVATVQEAVAHGKTDR